MPGTGGTFPRGTIAVVSRLFLTTADPGSPSYGLWAVETPTAVATRVGLYEWSFGGSDRLGAALNGRLVTDAMFAAVRSVDLPERRHPGRNGARCDASYRATSTGWFRVASGIAFFAASGENGRELWRPTPRSRPARVARTAQALSGAVRIPRRCREPLAAGRHATTSRGSDGTPDGTRLLKDVLPGVGGSSPGPFETMDGVVYWAGAARLTFGSLALGGDRTC